MKLLERAAVLLTALALAIGLIALLSGFFASRDQPGLSGGSPPGQRFADLGDRLLAPGELRPAYDSSPPTSGAHVPVAVTRDRTTLSDDQLLQALALGDVVLVFGARRAPTALSALARALAGRFTPALAAAGQAVILDRLPGTRGVIGLAWAHMVRTPSARDPRLRAFAAYWLGRGAPG